MRFNFQVLGLCEFAELICCSFYIRRRDKLAVCMWAQPNAREGCRPGTSTASTASTILFLLNADSS